MANYVDIVSIPSINADPSAFLWDKHRWSGANNLSVLLTAYYDSLQRDDNIVPGISLKNPMSTVTKYDGTDYPKYLVLKDETIQTSLYNYFLTDYSCQYITATDTITFDHYPNAKYPLLVFYKYFNHFNFYTLKTADVSLVYPVGDTVSGSDKTLFTYHLGATTISAINPVNYIEVTETFDYPVGSDTDHNEIQLSCYPVVPGQLTIGTDNINDFQVDYFFGIIRSTTLFVEGAATGVTITYKVGVGALYVPSLTNIAALTSEYSLTDLNIGENIVIKDNN